MENKHAIYQQKNERDEQNTRNQIVDLVQQLLKGSGDKENIQQLKTLLFENVDLVNLTVEFRGPVSTSQGTKKEYRYIVRGLFHVLAHFLFNSSKKTPPNEDQKNQLGKLLQEMLDLPQFEIEQHSSDMDNCLHFLTYYGAYALLLQAINTAFRREKFDTMTALQNTFSETPINVAEKRYRLLLLEDPKSPEVEIAKKAWCLLRSTEEYRSALFGGNPTITWDDVKTDEKFPEQTLSQKKPHSGTVIKYQHMEIKVAKQSDSNDVDLVIEITVPEAHFPSLEKFKAAWKEIFDDRVYTVDLCTKHDCNLSTLTITASKQIFFLHSLLQLLAIADLVYQYFGLDIRTAIQNEFYTYELVLTQVAGNTMPPFKHGNPTLIKLNDVTNDKISYYLYGRHKNSGSFQLTQLANIPALMELNFSLTDTKIQISPQKNAQIHEEIKNKGYQPFLISLCVPGHRSSEKRLEIKVLDKGDSDFIKNQQVLYVKADNIERLEKIASLLNGENFYSWFIESDNLFLFITANSPKKFQALQALVGKEIDNLLKPSKPLDKDVKLLDKPDEIKLLDENVQMLLEEFTNLCDYMKQSPKEIEQLKGTYLQWEEYFFIFTTQAKQLGIIDNHFLKSCECNIAPAQTGHQDEYSTTIKKNIYQMIQLAKTNKPLQEFRKTSCCFPRPRDCRVKNSTRTHKLLSFSPIFNTAASGAIQFCYLPNEADQVFLQFQELLKQLNPDILVNMSDENNLKVISISGEPIDQIKNDVDGQISFRILANPNKKGNFDVLIAKTHRLLDILWNWDDSVTFQKIEDNQKTYFVITAKPTQQLGDDLTIQQKPGFCLVM